MSPDPMPSDPEPFKAIGREEPSSFPPGPIIAVALFAALLKIGIALTSLGTNDVLAFYQFGKAIETHNLAWTYEHSVLFNHPPLAGYLLRALFWLARQPVCQQNGLTFPFFLRLPGVLADFALVLLLLAIVRKHPHLRPPRWALLLFAASPVSIMVTGFHGNTDPILVLLLVLATFLAVEGRPVLAGLVLALSCQVKIIPLLLFPLFFFFWVERRRAFPFVSSFVFSSILFCLEPLLKSPGAFLKNVLAYGSFWGVWGVTYCLRMTGLSDFQKTSFFSLSASQKVIMLILKIIVVLGILLLAWRRRKLALPALFGSMAYAWMIFFVFSPAVAAQYLLWLAPFILLLSPRFYGFLVAGSSIFLFALYTITSGGFPWYFAYASNKLSAICAHWALVPWLTMVGGLVALVWNTRRQQPNLRLLSLKTI
jgi:hypothetical protein